MDWEESGPGTSVSTDKVAPSVQKEIDWLALTVINTRGSSSVIRMGVWVGTPGHLLSQGLAFYTCCVNIAKPHIHSPILWVPTLCEAWTLPSIWFLGITSGPARHHLCPQGHPLVIPDLPCRWHYALLEPLCLMAITARPGSCSPRPGTKGLCRLPSWLGRLSCQPQRALGCSQDCPGAHTVPQLQEGTVSPGDSGEDTCLLWVALCKKVVLGSWYFFFSVGMRGGWITLLDLFPPINIINFPALRLGDVLSFFSP